DSVEVVEADAILGAALTLADDQHRRRLIRELRLERDSLGPERPHGLVESDLRKVEAAEILVLERGAHYDRLALAPAMHAQIVRDRADHVGPAPPQSTHAVAVRIHREAPIARGDELRGAHGAGIRAERGERIDRFLAREHQKLLKLAAKEGAARRIIES